MQPQVQINSQYPFVDSPVKRSVTYNLAKKISDFTIKVNRHQSIRQTHPYNTLNVNTSNSHLYQKFNASLCLSQSQPSMSKRICPNNGNLSQFYYNSGLPSIIPQEEFNRNAQQQQVKKPNSNIFKSDILQKMKFEQLQKQNFYRMVGRKQSKNYQNRIFKKRNQGKRTESAISIQKYSTTVKSSEQKNGYMNKEDVIAAMSPLEIVQSQNMKIYQQSDSSLNKVRNQMQTYQRLWAVQKNQLQRNKNNPNIRRPADCFKMALSMQRVIKNGHLSNLSILSSPRGPELNQININNTGSVKHQSILDLVDNYRYKIEKKYDLCLQQQKKHTSQNLWPMTLRSPLNMKTYHADKNVGKTDRVLKNDEFKIKGCEKIKNQLKWINQKNNHVFQPIDKQKLKIEDIFRKNNLSSRNNSINTCR